MANSARTAKGNATRVTIMTVARRLLVTQGFSEFGMREVAALSNIRLGNLQYYFPTRDELLMAVIKEEAQKDVITVNSAMDAVDEAQALRDIITRLLGRWRAEAGIIYTTLTLLAQHNTEFRRLYQQIYRDFYAAIEVALRCAKPGLDDQEYRIRTQLLTSLIDGAAFQVQLSRKDELHDRLLAEAISIALKP